MRFLMAVAMLLVAGSSPAESISDLLQGEPASWADLEVADLNARIDEAVAASLDWPDSPLQVTLQLFGSDNGVRQIALEEVKNKTEGADVTIVVYIRDGFLDDSVRGDWHEIHYRRLDDGTWRVSKARVAYRCMRGENTGEYQAVPCP